MNVTDRAFKALSENIALKSLLVHGADSIYKNNDDIAGEYPVVVYRNISDVATLSKDNAEAMHRVSIRVTIKTKDGDCDDIYYQVNACMVAAGFVRSQTMDYKDILDDTEDREAIYIYLEDVE